MSSLLLRQIKHLALNLARRGSLLVHELARKDDGRFRQGDGDWDLRVVPAVAVYTLDACVKPRAGLPMSRVSHQTTVVCFKSGSARCAVADTYLLRHKAMPGSTLTAR